MKEKRTIMGGHVVLSVMIAAMFAVTAFAVISFSASDDGSNDVLGADATVDITGKNAATIVEDIEDECYAGAEIIVTGSADVTERMDIDLNGANVIWEANITSSSGIEVYGGTFTKTANASWDIDWFYVCDGGEAVLNGNLTFEQSGDTTGVSDGKLTFKGNVAVGFDSIFANDDGIMIFEKNLTLNEGAYVYVNGGTIFINGKLTGADAEEYLDFNGTWLSINDREDESSEPGYYEYTDGVSYVFIKIPGSDNTMLIVAGIAIAVAVIGILVYMFVIRKR